MADEGTSVLETQILETQIEEWINPVSGTITSLFGTRINPITNMPEFHNGIDIAVPVGTPVLSVRCATVEHVNYSRLNGHYMRLRCDGGYYIIYAHLSEIVLNVGDRVSQGEKVALSGNTGQSTGPHLHYGLSRGAGHWVDPLDRVANLPKSANALMEYARR